MFVAVIGSRNIVNKSYINNILNKHLVKGDVIITGGALGVDTIAIDYAKDNELSYEIIRPVNPAIKAHYLYRNIEIITKADKIIAIWDGVSRGTKFGIDYAKARGKEVIIIK